MIETAAFFKPSKEYTGRRALHYFGGRGELENHPAFTKGDTAVAEVMEMASHVRST